MTTQQRVSSKTGSEVWVTTCVALMLLGCGDSADQTDGDGDESGILTVTATATETTTVGATGTGDATGTGAATDDGCPQERMCGNGCCPSGELCQAGECVLDCGGEPACGSGDTQQCCEGAEICYVGACVTPGAACGAAACATLDESTCAEDEVCEPTIGACVPATADETCTFVPPPQVFDPVPLFTWGQRLVRNCVADADCQKEEVCGMAGTCEVTWNHVDLAMDDLPTYYQVTSTPVVVDLDGDCVPEVVFNSYQNSAFTTDGVLRAIRGDNGARVWTVDDPTMRTDSTSNPAVGDLDGDGAAEVIAQATGIRALVAIDSDGTSLWMSDVFTGPENSGSPAIANLDGEGDAEIVYGRAVFDSMGTLIWEGAAGAGHGGQGPIPCIADLDGDTRPELVGGRTAYSFTGTMMGGDFVGGVLWEAGGLDGYCGVADFNADQMPEVVLVRGGSIDVLNGQTGVVMATLGIPGAGHGGAPNIADFDGDGVPDIGTAGGSNYVVMTFNGVDTLQILWQAVTEDDSSNRTGSSVFDFDGDGQSEVIYGDEEFLRIYPGSEPDCGLVPPGPLCDGLMTDMEVLFQDLNSSRTRTEYPVVADANGDFKAEAVFATNNEASFLDPAFLGDAGIEVWKDRLDNWMPTRPVWNQHSYHVTNVGNRGEIPLVESDNWTTPMADPYNSYRRNTQGDLDFCAPDLVPRDLQSVFMSCPDLDLSVWVVNEGCLGVGPGVNVAFYEQTLGLLGVVQTQAAIVPGAAERVFLDVPQAMGSDYQVWVVVDDDGMGMGALNECDEANNQSDPIDACQSVG